MYSCVLRWGRSGGLGRPIGSKQSKGMGGETPWVLTGPYVCHLPHLPPPPIKNNAHTLIVSCYTINTQLHPPPPHERRWVPYWSMAAALPFMAMVNATTTCVPTYMWDMCVLKLNVCMCVYIVLICGYVYIWVYVCIFSINHVYNAYIYIYIPDRQTRHTPCRSQHPHHNAPPTQPNPPQPNRQSIKPTTPHTHRHHTTLQARRGAIRGPARAAVSGGGLAVLGL